uniref:uncharacterized protein isoform X3 n=1 Tax=Myxine glutinosa TaxID=7769 RepID=UPI00358EB8EF
MVMDRDPPICTHDPNSSDSKSVSDGGNTGGPGGVHGICGFRILDVQKLRDGHGGDGTDQEPDPIVVMKVEPEPTGGFPSPDLNEEVKVKLELGENCSSQDETGRVTPGGFHGNVPQMLNVTPVKEEPCEESLSAEETPVEHPLNLWSCPARLFSHILKRKMDKRRRTSFALKKCEINHIAQPLFCSATTTCFGFSSDHLSVEARYVFIQVKCRFHLVKSCV